MCTDISGAGKVVSASGAEYGYVARIKLICTLKQQHFYKYALISAVTRARARMSKKKL